MTCDVQEMVRKWKKENEGRLIDPYPEDGEHNTQRFCCLMYHMETRVCDCEKRRGNNRTHYTPIHLGREVYRTPKPKFIHCVDCNVWKQMPPQTEVETRISFNYPRGKTADPNKAFARQSMCLRDEMRSKRGKI